MNRLEKLKQTIGSKSWDDFWLRNKPFPVDGEEKLKDPYKSSDLVYICISTTAKAIAQVPLKVGSYNASEEWEPVAQDHPWQRLIDKPNYLVDKYSFIEGIVSYLLLDGECFQIPFPVDKAIPESIWVVSKKNMQPKINNSTGQLDGWLYRVNDNDSGIGLNLLDVSHTFFWNPYDPFRGFAPLEAGKIPISTDYKASKFNQVFFDNNASIGGLLSTEQNLNEAQHDRLKNELKEKYRGYRNAHEMLILYGGMKYQSTSPSHKDMMFKDLRGLDKEKILQVFGMKKAIISVTDDLNFATAENQRKSWWQDTNLPIMKLITSALNFTFLEKFGLECKFDTSSIEALQEDFDKKVETAVKLKDLGFSPNEINEKLGLGFDSQPIRDIIWMPNTQIPYKLQDTPEPEEPEEEEIPLEELPVVEEEPEEETFLPLSTLTPSGNMIEYIKDNFNEEGMRVWKNLVNSGGEKERSFRGKVNKAFYFYRNRVLAWLYNQEKTVKGKPFILTSPLTDLDLISVEPFEDLKKAADRLYEESLLEGIETIAVGVDDIIPVDVLSGPRAQQFLLDKKIRLVGDDGIQRTISKQLNRSISEGIGQGETIEQIAGRIKGIFGVARSRVNTIARTEVYGSLNHGRYLAGEESGRIGAWQWFTALDEKVRVGTYDHLSMHGVERSKGEPWIVSGESLRHPGDYMGSAGNVINCRCIEMPVLTSIQ